MEVVLKRVYDGCSSDDGLRIFVDRLWPRGLSKSSLPYDILAKEVAPSPQLRRFYHLNPQEHWEQFSIGYAEELKDSVALKQLVEEIRKLSPERVTLLYAFKSRVQNHALVLKQAIEDLIK